MNNIWILAGYECRKLIFNRITLVTLIVSMGFLFLISIQNYVLMPSVRDSWKVEHFLDGRDMDDSFFNELCVVYDDDWNFPEDSAYRFAAAYVIRHCWIIRRYRIFDW